MWNCHINSNYDIKWDEKIQYNIEYYKLTGKVYNSFD